MEAGGGEYNPGWRVVFKGLVASAKTLCSAPCLLNRAKLIWVCLGLLLGNCLPPSFSLFHLNFSDSLSRSRTLWLDTWLLTHINCSERSVDLWARDSSIKLLDTCGLHQNPSLSASLCTLSLTIFWQLAVKFKENCRFSKLFYAPLLDAASCTQAFAWGARSIPFFNLTFWKNTCLLKWVRNNILFQ